ncbi:MAG: DNA methyltransferase [Prevotella sp.]|nr:N-6 DNA methylase [Prevotellaceae bacterium]MDY5844567.1 DNA methyltransferase [Prevotella sp.]
MLTEKQQRTAAAEFIKRWKGRGYEKGESQLFWIDLLTNVYGISDAANFIRFEQQARLDHTSFIDAMIPSTHVMIEQKSLGKNLRQPIKQSDGNMLTPFQQAQRYSAVLPYSERPRWIVTCNFAEFDVYDMENPKGEPSRIELKDLEREYYRLQFLVEVRSVHLERELQVSMQAGEIVGRIYDELIKQYDETDPMALRSLNILCVRLVFCLYAEDAGVFPRHDMFHDYLESFDVPSMRMALLQLFDTLNTPTDKRSKYIRPDLAAFPYTNGGLFAEETDIPQFTPELRNTLLKHASLDFDWSLISPTIFGGVFESTLNPETRRAGGMHYTSIENIHKVIDPLFMNQLWREFEACKEIPDHKKRVAALLALQDKMAGLRFFDPACGSGNFLTETYLSLRRLENEILSIVYNRIERSFFENPIKVNIHQFYGIEINDFAVTVATTALWISEAQMIAETERIINHDIDFLPLKSYANIHEGNSLRTDWNSICNKSELDYIIGNPPFVGARLMSESQKEDMLAIFGAKWKNVGNIDYVGAWYKRAADYMQGTEIQAALVSTNSISQGEQVANLWQPLFEQGVRINFAHRTFRWDSEASLKAHVHVVVVGFSYVEWKQKLLFDNGQKLQVSNLNAYLCDAPNVFIYSRSTSLCDVSVMGIGNKPIDGGNYLFTKEEKEEFVKREPQSEVYFHPWYGATEFIQQQPRYCLWLGDCSPREIKSMPLCYERVTNVRELRLASKSAGTRKLADTPTRFHVENMPEGTSIIVPSTSSERRKYVPMGFIPQGTLASNAVLLIPSATLYHFGVLESNVHMAWMRAVCGRLKSDYRYSKDIVYNNFPWPDATDEQRTEIAQAAQRILDARQLYPDSSLADLYDPTLMPHELLKAHRDNDRLVMRLYGFPTSMTETECVAQLFKLYQKKCKG